jgi:hypothetical protein
MVTSVVMGFMAKLRVAIMSRGAVGDNAVQWRYGFWAKLQGARTAVSARPGIQFRTCLQSL